MQNISRGQQCCVKASAAFQRQNKQLNTYKVIYTLFVFERNVFERNEPEEPSSNRPRNPVECSACAVARKIETDCLRRNLPISNDPVIRISRNLAKN